MKNAFVWVDIPVGDLDRAMAFYSAVIGEAVSPIDHPGFRFALFPHADKSVSGCLITPHDAQNGPGIGGPLVYLNVDGRMADAVAAVTAHGGQVVQDVHQIDAHGFRAVVIDSEGNRVAFHAQSV